MRIGRLFAVSMLSVTVLAVVLAPGVLVPQYRTFASKTEAIKAVEAYGAVLAVGQQVAGYRAPYVSPLFQDGAATPAQLDASREGGAGGGCGVRESADGRRRAQRWRGDRRRPQPGGGQARRGSHRDATARSLLPMSARDPAA